MKNSPAVTRRKFIKQTGMAVAVFAFPFPLEKFNMKDHKKFDVIIIGGSYSGLAAAMALGRALKNVLVIDSGRPCNFQTSYSHNFLTHDGSKPDSIAALGKSKVLEYDTVQFYSGTANGAKKTPEGFEILTEEGEQFQASKLIFATGIKDIMPKIEGFSECWGISAIHCPYCHGYEVRSTPTGILGNGDYAFELSKMILNWTSAITIFINGKSELTVLQTAALKSHNIEIIETEIQNLEHSGGYIENVIFSGGAKFRIKALYSPRPFLQHCQIPESLGCSLTEEGYIKVNALQESSIEGVYACGDNTTRMRTLANAVAMGTVAGMATSKKLILEHF